MAIYKEETYGFTYEIQEKKVKYYRIQVKSTGEVKVSVPKGYSSKFAHKMVKDKADWIMQKLEEIQKSQVLSMKETSWKWEDEDYFLWLVEKIYPRFSNYQIPYPKLSFRKMKSRWGSCQKTRAEVTLNKMLKLVSRDCQEYVIVHELAHLVEANHSKRFYAVVENIMPDYKQREADLKEYVIRA